MGRPGVDVGLLLSRLLEENMHRQYQNDLLAEYHRVLVSSMWPHPVPYSLDELKLDHQIGLLLDGLSLHPKSTRNTMSSQQ